MCEGKLYISEAPKTAVPVGATLAGWFLYISYRTQKQPLTLSVTYFPVKVSRKEKGPQKWSPTADQLQRGSLARGKNPQTDAVIHKETKNP